MILNIDSGEYRDITLGTTGLDDIRQCLQTLMATIRGSVFLDRELGIDGTVIDMPINRVGKLFEAVHEAVEIYEPRVNILEIKPYKSDMDGQLQVKVKFEINEEVL